MAEEIQITAKIKCTNGEFSLPTHGVSNQKVDQTTQGYVSSTEATSTTAELLELNDVANPGYGFFKNLDATDTISIGFADNQFIVELGPKEVALFRVAGTTITVKASANTPKLYYVILED